MYDDNNTRFLLYEYDRPTLTHASQVLLLLYAKQSYYDKTDL